MASYRPEKQNKLLKCGRHSSKPPSPLKVSNNKHGEKAVHTAPGVVAEVLGVVFGGGVAGVGPSPPSQCPPFSFPVIFLNGGYGEDILAQKMLVFQKIGWYFKQTIVKLRTKLLENQKLLLPLQFFI